MIKQLLSFNLSLILFLLYFKEFSIQAEQLTVDTRQDHFIFMNTNEIQSVGIIEKDFYGQAIAMLPICCVDVFVYNPHDKTYFLILRDKAPAKGIYCVPGGRLYKGESFFACAKRKCLEEAGLSIQPVRILKVYSTIFPDSEWECQTHTINVVIFALTINNSNNASVDNNHTQYQWINIDQTPEHPYIKDIYQTALEYLKEISF